MKNLNKIYKGHFLQSKEWEEFQRALGRETFRINGALFVKLPLAFGKIYLYSVGANASVFPRPLSLTIREGGLGRVSYGKSVVFLKYEPMAEDKLIADELLQAGFKKSAKEVQPQKTLILDLTKSEEELLAEMHQKARYNIRLAEKKDLRFMSYDLRDSSEVFEDFWGLIQKTAQRDEFNTHTKEYYEKLLKSFSSQYTIYDIPYTKLFYVERQYKMIAASIVMFYNHCATYLHGASDYKYRNLMAPYLLHWEIIKYAKTNGYKNYDFWGIDEKKWPGVTRFKRGFGGRGVSYIGSFNYIFQPFWYKLYKCGSFLRSRRISFLPRQR